MDEPVLEAEIKVGLVLELDQVTLEAAEEVRLTLPQSANERAKPRPGPFVCIRVEDGVSCWAPLTSRPRSERLEIQRGWRAGGAGQWLTANTYLNDGANLYFCPASSLLEACSERSPRRSRRRIISRGVKAILQEVEKQESRQIRQRTAGHHEEIEHGPMDDANRI